MKILLLSRLVSIAIASAIPTYDSSAPTATMISNESVAPAQSTPCTQESATPISTAATPAPTATMIYTESVAPAQSTPCTQESATPISTAAPQLVDTPAPASVSVSSGPAYFPFKNFY